MQNLIWIGAVIALIGLAGIVWCIVTVFRAKRRGMDDAAMRETLRGLVAINLGAMFVAVLGLMTAVIGAALG
ncbi:hypothetical protein ERN12_01385 [Rhodobacteraceae bacterium]|nr:hypothetical protein ERN12_01385 [Paracoccaceae bacterium]